MVAGRPARRWRARCTASAAALEHALHTPQRVRNGGVAAHLGAPEDVARACVYLLEGAGFVTGSVITVDGGRTLL